MKRRIYLFIYLFIIFIVVVIIIIIIIIIVLVVVPKIQTNQNEINRKALQFNCRRWDWQKWHDIKTEKGFNPHS